MSPKDRRSFTHSSFECKNCSKKVSLRAPGTHHRNHCPFCLFSIHIDVKPGDRAASCGGLMKAVGKYYKEDGEEMLVHECTICRTHKKNRVAGDDSIEEINKLPEVTAL